MASRKIRYGEVVLKKKFKISKKKQKKQKKNQKKKPENIEGGVVPVGWRGMTV